LNLGEIMFQKTDSNLRQNVLGSLEKFSLRRRPQSLMIELDMIVWITSVLTHVK
jgi:hypothetical protein